MRNCIKCEKPKQLIRGICKECRDIILRPHYLKPVAVKKGGKNV